MGDERGTRVYVGNLGEKVKKEDLEGEFTKYGKLNSVWVAFNPPGFAFVEFENRNEAEKACDILNGTEVLGSKLRVEISKGRPRGRRDGGGGRSGGGRFGSGGGGRRDGGGGFRGGQRDGGGFRSSGGSGGGYRNGGSGGFRSRDNQRSSDDTRFTNRSGGFGGSGGFRSGGRDGSAGGGRSFSGGAGFNRNSAGGGGGRFRSRSPAGRSRF